MKVCEQKIIALRGGYGRGNFGDDALMIAVYEVAKRIFDAGSFVFICPDANYIKTLLPSAEVVAHENRIGKLIDWFIYGGGTQFYSFPLTAQKQRPSLIARVVRNMKNPLQLGRKIVSKLNKPMVGESGGRKAAIGIGLGPFVENCSVLRETRKLFASMEYIAVRDVHSYALCKEWGCTSVVLRSDLCYFPGLWNNHSSGNQTRRAGRPIQKIGIIIRDWPHSEEGDAYADPLFHVVDTLRADGRDVDFISFSDKSDTRWARRLIDRHEPCISWKPDEDSIKDYLAVLSGYDLFLTARYHGAVFASVLGIPVVCVEVEQKLRLMSDLLGPGSRLWANPFSVSDCLRHVSSIEDDYSSAIECLSAVVREQGVLVEKTINEYRQILTRGRS